MNNDQGLCPVIAAQMLSGRPMREVRAYAEKHYGFQGKGMPFAHVVMFVEDLVGPRKRLKVVKGESAEEVARKINRGLVVAGSHVMPVVDGVLRNKCGWGEEPAHIVVEF